MGKTAIQPHIEVINGLEFKMLPVPGGPFFMGSSEGNSDAFSSEYPQHKVTIGDFFLGQYPVTQALWMAVMGGENPSFFLGENRPVERVSWNDAQTFMKKLNLLSTTTRPVGYNYCLPTEAQWEYAARGGPYHSDSYLYAGSDRLKEVGWYNENSSQETKSVGQKYPNQLGFYELCGNVWEWCEDDWHNNYNGAPADGSAWVDLSKGNHERVLRGGGWFNTSRNCRATQRIGYAPTHRDIYIGFRLASPCPFSQMVSPSRLTCEQKRNCLNRG